MYTSHEKRVLIAHLTHQIEKKRKEMYKDIKGMTNAYFDKLVSDIKENHRLITLIEA